MSRATVTAEVDERHAKLVAVADKLAAERAAHAETRKALEDIHKVTGRGEGHGSPKATADCVISAWMSRGMALDESESALARAEALVKAALDYANGRWSEWGERAERVRDILEGTDG